MFHTEETKKRISETKKKNPTRFWLGKKRPDMIGNQWAKLAYRKKTIFIKVCLFCKEEMIVAGWNLFGKNFCSKKCADSYKRISYKNKKITWGDKISKKLKGVPKIWCRGENNWHWIKDRTKLAKHNERNDYAYLEWAKQVRRRDNYKCIINNSDCDGRLEVHHILGWKPYPELRYNINNGITLCHAHHPKNRAEEKRLIPFFTELVPVSN